MSEKETTDELLASRREIYGDRVQNMERTAALWSALLGIKIHDWQVPLMMSAYKMLRTFETPDYSDNSDDIDGWKKMFVEVMDANHGGIVQARTVEEYQRKKQYGDAWDAAVDSNQSAKLDMSDSRSIRIGDYDFTINEINAVVEYYRTLGENLKPRHPYENAERDAEAEAMEASMPPRCSFYLQGQRCSLREGHFGTEHKFPTIRTRQRGE